MYPEDMVIDTDDLKLNSIIDVVGFLDRRPIYEDDEDLDDELSLVEETYCIHTVKYKFCPNLITENEEMRKLTFFIYS